MSHSRCRQQDGKSQVTTLLLSRCDLDRATIPLRETGCLGYAAEMLSHEEVRKYFSPRAKHAILITFSILLPGGSHCNGDLRLPRYLPHCYAHDCETYVADEHKF